MTKMRLIAPDNDMASQRINQGDVLVIEKTETVTSEGIYALMTTEGLKIRCTSPVGDPFIPESFEISAIVGKVVRIEIEV